MACEARYVTPARVFALLACILFVLTAFGVSFGAVHLGWLGLAFLAASFLC